jgi:probable F420-dependent oxidoreductase
LTLMSYLAAITARLQLVTAILILPQRQTALVAKQAAEVDVLSGGRLRLGIGVGWNPVEYEALGEDFQNRGRRCEEQITVLRALWTQEVVNFTGQWHRITHAGLNPRPIQRPIPIWIGAGRSARPIPPEAALRRIGRLADGWFPMFAPGEEGRNAIARMRGYAREAGRDPAAIGIEGRVAVTGKGPQDWLTQVKAWEELGATHLSVGTGGAGLKSPQEHIEALRRFQEAMGGISQLQASPR